MTSHVCFAIMVSDCIYVMFTATCSVVFTADEGVRGGKVIPLKATVDDAVAGCDCVRRVFVAKRTGAQVNMQTGRDVWLEEVRVLLYGGSLQLLKSMM